MSDQIYSTFSERNARCNSIAMSFLISISVKPSRPSKGTPGKSNYVAGGGGYTLISRGAGSAAITRHWFLTYDSAKKIFQQLRQTRARNSFKIADPWVEGERLRGLYFSVSLSLDIPRDGTAIITEVLDVKPNVERNVIDA